MCFSESTLLRARYRKKRGRTTARPVRKNQLHTIHELIYFIYNFKNSDLLFINQFIENNPIFLEPNGSNDIYE